MRNWYLIIMAWGKVRTTPLHYHCLKKAPEQGEVSPSTTFHLHCNTRHMQPSYFVDLLHVHSITKYSNTHIKDSVLLVTYDNRYDNSPKTKVCSG